MCLKIQVYNSCVLPALTYGAETWILTEHAYAKMERGSSAVERRTRNQVSLSSNPTLLPFRRLGIFVLSIDVLVDSAV